MMLMQKMEGNGFGGRGMGGNQALFTQLSITKDKK